ncbi:MAG: hypothetical protein IPO27_17185 [Bacteroidetes bacterium]|nr:hypothetical protein [Bacteroidota bacterium]
MKHKLLIILFGLLALSLSSMAQAGPELIEQVRKRFATVIDYQAKAIIKTDVTFIKILPVNANVYYKKPDKMHIETKGIALMPKQGHGYLFTSLLQNKQFLIVDAGEQIFENKKLKQVKLIPVDDTSDIVLGTLMIDPLTLLIHKARITSKSNGTVDMQFTYGKYSEYLLPDMLTIEMDVAKFKIPKALAGDLESGTAKKTNDKSNKRGKVVITYKEYIINKGLADSIFRKK